MARTTDRRARQVWPFGSRGVPIVQFSNPLILPEDAPDVFGARKLRSGADLDASALELNLAVQRAVTRQHTDHSRLSAGNDAEVLRYIQQKTLELLGALGFDVDSTNQGQLRYEPGAGQVLIGFANRIRVASDPKFETHPHALIELLLDSPAFHTFAGQPPPRGNKTESDVNDDERKMDENLQFFPTDMSLHLARMATATALQNLAPVLANLAQLAGSAVQFSKAKMHRGARQDVAMPIFVWHWCAAYQSATGSLPKAFFKDKVPDPDVVASLRRFAQLAVARLATYRIAEASEEHEHYRNSIAKVEDILRRIAEPPQNKEPIRGSVDDSIADHIERQVQEHGKARRAEEKSHSAPSVPKAK